MEDVIHQHLARARRDRAVVTGGPTGPGRGAHRRGPITGLWVGKGPRDSSANGAGAGGRGVSRDPTLRRGTAWRGCSHHGQSHQAEDQHAGPEQRSLREASAQPPDEQALDDLGEGTREGRRGPALRPGPATRLRPPALHCQLYPLRLPRVWPAREELIKGQVPALCPPVLPSARLHGGGRRGPQQGRPGTPGT